MDTIARHARSVLIGHGSAARYVALSLLVLSLGWVVFKTIDGIFVTGPARAAAEFARVSCQTGRVLVADSKGIVLRASDDLLEEYHWSRSHIVGGGVFHMIPPEMRRIHHEALKAAVDRGHLTGGRKDLSGIDIQEVRCPLIDGKRQRRDSVVRIQMHKVDGQILFHVQIDPAEKIKSVILSQQANPVATAPVGSSEALDLAKLIWDSFNRQERLMLAIEENANESMDTSQDGDCRCEGVACDCDCCCGSDSAKLDSRRCPPAVH